MFEKIAAYLAKQMDIDASQIAMETTFESLGIDSLDTVETVSYTHLDVYKRQNPS